MDTDLAFCLGQFIDEQVAAIDKVIENLKQEETVECAKIQQAKVAFIQQRGPEKNKGSHFEDNNLVDRFVKELRNDDSRDDEKRQIFDDQTCVDTLRAEVTTKINASWNYLNRLRNLAKSVPNSAKFIQSCDETVERFRRSRDVEANFNQLYKTLEDSDADNVVTNTQAWWRSCYGDVIKELNDRNKKFNAAVTDASYATLSPTSRVITNAKKLIAARTVVEVPSTKGEIIRKFVEDLMVIDEELREKTTPDVVIQELTNNDTSQNADYANRWLRKRDEIRNHKEEDPYEIKLEEVKAEYGRRQIAQESKKLALAALLCRLAVGSSNGDQFDRQLKTTINRQRESNQNTVPVTTGDIGDPERNPLIVSIHLDVDNTDTKQWANNSDDFQQKLLSTFCAAMDIPETGTNIDNFEPDDGLVNFSVTPPYGGKVVDNLNGTAPDSAARMQALRRGCRAQKIEIHSIVLGEFGLQIEAKLMDPRWNRVYVWPGAAEGAGNYWGKPINQGGKPYFCPSGWKRYGIKVAEDEKEFDARWGTWNVAYHGTAGENAVKILTSGLRVSTRGCFYGDGVPRVYVSPSIEYCAHPRYATPWCHAKKNGVVMWYQLILQCRVNPASVSTVGQETLIQKQYKSTVKVDPNFDNQELTWIILGKTNQEFVTDSIVCYGLMLRTSTIDPCDLPPSAWWKHSDLADCYKKTA